MTCWTSTNEETVEQQQKWWHDSMSALASQLRKGVLNEMKTRILTSNIKKEKLDRLIAVDDRVLRARAQAVRDAQTKHKKETGQN
jgi:hypothetical protein